MRTRLDLILICSSISIWLMIRIAESQSMSKPGCPKRCGNVTIPYPFGIGSECSGNSSFTITCQNSTGRLRPFLSSINMEVVKISLSGVVIVNQPVSPINCSVEQKRLPLGNSILGSPFTFSSRHNRLAVLGCKNAVWLRKNETATAGGCNALCDENSTDTSCNGVNCCQTIIPSHNQELSIIYKSLEFPLGSGFCGYILLVDLQWLQHSYRRYHGFGTDPMNPFDRSFQHAPLVLEWEFDDPTYNPLANCTRYHYPSNYGSITGQIDYHENYYSSSSKQCSCRLGFGGNPYFPGGCQDINECNSSTFKHCPEGTCINEIGSFRCYSPEDNKSRISIALISVGTALGALLLLVGAWKSYKVVKKRIKAKHIQRYFKHNGGLLLEKQLSSTANGVEKTKLFSSKELAQATDHYNENRVLGSGGQGTVYKGMLSDGKIVAVKKSRRVSEGDLEVFINEVVILSQINHRNVVKLLGCCLETEVPLLVYEFVPNGTLFQHIHDPTEEFPLSWEIRLRIAIEIASALSYLHSAASVPIYHREIKSTNILLDEKYRAKVSDFGTSRSVSIDQTHLTTRVLGTFGYLDPEYFQSSQFTEKSDVYSFGVVLVELLTGEKAVSSLRPQEEPRSLVTYFLDSMKENHLFDILDPRVVREGRKQEEVMAMAQLAKRCLNLHGRHRPMMKTVVLELERIQELNTTSVVEEVNEEGYHSIELFESCDSTSVSESRHLDTTTAFSSDGQALLSEIM